MIRLIKNLSLFILVLLVIIITLDFIFFSFYKIPVHGDKVVMGDSTGKASIDTRITNNYTNFSQGGDSYLIIYNKVKALNKSQKLDTLLVTFSPSNIINNDWLNASTTGKSRYLPIINLKDQEILFYKNPRLFMNSYFELSKETFGFFNSRTISFGGYTPNIKSYEHKFYTPTLNREVTSIQVEYLKKIELFCKKEKIYLILINFPKYIKDKNYPNYNSKAFLDLYYKLFNHIDYIDLSSYTILQSENYFADMIHLNENGAEKISYFFKENSLKNIISSEYNLKTNNKLIRIAK